MKKLLTVIIVFVLFIVTSLTVDILRQQFYPYEYQDVMESFFGKYHIKNGKNQKLPVFNFQIHTTASSYSCSYHIIFFHNYPQEHEFHVFSNVQACP